MTTATALKRPRRRILIPVHRDALSLDYLQARPIVTRTWTRLHIALVGCGGTGSWLAPGVARLASEMRQAGRDVEVTFVDPDHIESKNVPRQNFCLAECGRNKAAALALRYGMAWGIDIAAVPAPFKGKDSGWLSDRELHVIVGCVDNAAARREIASAVQSRNAQSERAGQPPHVWWLDCGNSRESGQVLLGSSDGHAYLRHSFEPDTICRSLPSPSMQRPELLEDLPEEAPDANLSCAELAARNAQSLSVNQAVAALAFDYLLRLVHAGGLRRFATYLDLRAGVYKSLYTTPTAVGRVLGKSERWFAAKKTGGK